MANSYIKYVGDGSTTGPYSVPFPYLSQDHVVVTVNGASVPFTWASASTITLTTAAALNAVIFIRRVTERDSRLVDYTNGSMLSETVLDTDSLQAFYLVQEAYDWITINADADGLVFSDREALLSTLNGYLDTSVLTTELSTNLKYLVDKFVTDDAIFREIGDDAVYEDGVIESYLNRIDYAKVDVLDLEARIVLAAGQITTLESDTGDIETRMTAAELDIDGAEASIVAAVADISTNEDGITYNAGIMSLMADEYFVKLDSNGSVSGFGLYNGATSQFTVNADKFAIIRADGTGAVKKPFTVDTSTGVIGIDGSLVVSGSIVAGSMNVSTLSAITANLGTITAGIIQSANWATTNGSKFDLSTGKLEIRTSQGIYLTQGADIEIVSTSSDQAQIRFSSPGKDDLTFGRNYTYDGLCLMPETAGSGHFQIGFDYETWSTKRMSGFAAWVDGSVLFDVDDGSETGHISANAGWCEIIAQASGTTIELSVDAMTTEILCQGRIRPNAHKTFNLGGSAVAWDSAYADDWINVADFYWMDERVDKSGELVKINDVQVIQDIVPTKSYDPVSGLRIINDSSIPTWLVKKHNSDGQELNKDGERTQTWRKGETAYSPEGKPYLSLKTMISLLMGAVRQLDNRIKEIETDGKTSSKSSRSN